MNALHDFTLITTIINFVSMVGNIYWSIKLTSIKGNGELVAYWKQECEKLQNEKKDLELQYHHQHTINKRLEGELLTYKKFHNHSTFDNR